MRRAPAGLGQGLMVAGALLLALILTPRLAARAIMNAAQWQRAQGAPDAALYQSALALDPGDDHLRLQAGAGLQAAGAYAAAAAALEPLAARPGANQATVLALLGSLVAAGENAQALALYQRAGGPSVPPWVAAGLLLAPAVRSGEAGATTTGALAETVFGLDRTVPDFGGAITRLSESAFWAGAVGARARAALAWAGRPPPEGRPVNATPDTGVLAALLRSDAEPQTLGPEQIVNGGFEQPSLVNSVGQGWHASFMSTGRPWNFGLFLVGVDSSRAYQGRAALRVEGIELEQRADREPARAGLWHSAIAIPAGAAYAMSFVYTTRGLADNGASFWLGDEPLLAPAGDQYLPAAEGQWRRVTVVAWNRSGKDAAIAPLLRAWGQGSLWVDSVSVRLLSLAPAGGLRPPLTDVRLAGAP